jgi:K(+)-stimulated pyrophosphate-energized sodium pump
VIFTEMSENTTVSDNQSSTDSCWFCYNDEDLSNVRIAIPPFITAVLGIFTVSILIMLIFRAPRGTEKMESIGRAIKLGAMTFLKYEYSVLAVVVLLLYVLVSVVVHWRTGICYLVGASSSAFCGFFGMWICTSSNVRTAAAAERGLNQGLRVAFNAGSVMGLTVVSVGLGALSILLVSFNHNAIEGTGAMAGFGMGASTVSIIARVGGGVYTKAADVGADLVGKVEKSLPEDDPRNPATIADNVGDNVGDVAGMGADLYSSFVGSIVASSILGHKDFDQKGIALPFWISMAGIVAAVIGVSLVRTKENATQRDLLSTLRTAQIVAGVFQVGFIATICAVLDITFKLFGCIVIGLTAGLALGIISEFFTSYGHIPTVGIAKSARIGAANVIIEGVSVGMYACILPALIIASVVIACQELAGAYGIALASTGLLSTLGITLATDAYGPVADNAGGIAEMAHMPEHTRKNTDLLDALGNTTAAIGKGFAVGSAVLTAISLLNTFISRMDIPPIDPVTSKRFGAGIVVGAMLPFWFGAMTMGAVNRAAQSVILEVRRQFANNPGLLTGESEPDYAACVGMISLCALHAMVFPVALVVLAPIITGIGLGPQFLCGLLFGAIVTGFMLGLMMGTSGGAWDNAKKYIETGKYGGKRSLAHKAAVIGDTVGDPFKDTTGPAINIQIKLMSYISVTLVPVFKHQSDYWWASLIVIGVLIFFVPFWQTVMVPEALRRDRIEATIDEIARANEENVKSGKIEEHKDKEDDDHGVQMTEQQFVRVHHAATPPPH